MVKLQAGTKLLSSMFKSFTKLSVNLPQSSFSLFDSNSFIVSSFNHTASFLKKILHSVTVALQTKAITKYYQSSQLVKTLINLQKDI